MTELAVERRPQLEGVQQRVGMAAGTCCDLS